MAQTFLVPGREEVASETLWVVGSVVEVQMSRPDGCLSGILVARIRNSHGSGANLVEKYSPNAGLSDNWLGRNDNIPSWPEAVEYLAWVDGTDCPLMRSSFDGFPANWSPGVASGYHHVHFWVGHCSNDLWMVGFGNLWLELRC